jgi:hypothetical protein
MTYEKDPFEFKGIPDYALQPAKEADEYSFHYTPRGATNRFDPAAYEKVLYDSVRQAAENEEQSELLDIREDKAPEAFGEPAAPFPQPMEETLPTFGDISAEAEPAVADQAEEPTVADQAEEPEEAVPVAQEEEAIPVEETAPLEEAVEVFEEEAPAALPAEEEDVIPVFTAPARPATPCRATRG